jgi:hypothetical protein
MRKKTVKKAVKKGTAKKSAVRKVYVRRSGEETFLPPKSPKSPEKKKKNMKGRPRGGASMPCPECGGDSHVIITNRVLGTVMRARACLQHDHRFKTVEQISTGSASRSGSLT